MFVGELPGEWRERERRPKWAARVFVLSELERVLDLVRGLLVGSTGLAGVAVVQGGRLARGGRHKVVEVDGTQVVVFGMVGTARETFGAAVIELAEGVAEGLGLDEVVVELQERGVAAETIGVVPPGR